MKLSERWLREWVDPPVDTSQLVEQLTMAGLEVDSVVPAAPPFEGVVVGRVASVAPHPDAERLTVCSVDVGEAQPLIIVCGAPNVTAGMLAPTARVGAVLPDGTHIRKAKLRGVESSGMLCSARELGLAESAAGLLALPADAPVGREVRDYLELDDQLIEIDLTPNRGDCLGVLGIAREVGVLNRCAVRALDVEPVPVIGERRFPVAVSAPAACPRYLGRVIEGVDPKAETPLWMKERLRRAGLRSLGPVVDVTNYVLMELGQPMHAFDLDRLSGGIEVRLARPDEPVALLDGQTVRLQADTLVIADDREVLALAGIMGGQDSAVGAETRSLFLECAFFAPQELAGHARRYGLHTESSHRFERGVDPGLQRVAMERATALLLQVAGGAAGPIIEVASEAHLPAPQTLTLRAERIRRLLGAELDGAEVQDILRRLGMQVESRDDHWQVTPPGFRFDIAREADLIEELARIHGYARLPSTPALAPMRIGTDHEVSVGEERIRALLADRGYQEAVTYSFVDPQLQERFHPGETPIALANPLSAELSVMRLSLWPGLIKAVLYNQARQQNAARLFETGLKFVPQADGIRQEKCVAGVLSGSALPEQWGEAVRAADFFDIKADVEALLALGRQATVTYRAEAHPALHPGQSTRILMGDTPAGWLGALHPRLERDLELAGRTLLFELELSSFEGGRLPRFQELSKFPAIRRDVAVVVDCAVSGKALQDCAALAAGELLRELRLFDVYQGKGIESGRKSMGLGLILQDSSRTLTDRDVETVIEAVLARLQQEFGATLRD